MNWNTKVILNHGFYALLGVIGVIAALPNDVLDVVPPRYKPQVVTAIAIAAWIKAHVNLNTVPPPPPAK